MNPIVTGMMLAAAAVFAWWFGKTVAGRSKQQLARGRLTLQDLAARMDVPVEAIAGHRPHYSTVRIPKRNKRDGGFRTLQIPDAKTKQLQRRLLRRVLAGLKVHEAACGFEAGKCIVDAARPHVGRAVVVRMDVVNFFPSTSADRIADYFRFIGWDEESIQVLLQLTTWESGLPQGAPTSPRLSNLVNGLLDSQLAGLAATKRGHYTRYADDLTFSFRRISGKRVRGTIQQVKKILAAHGYQLHTDQKLRIRRRHQRQEVLGLVVNNGINIPRRKRRWLRAVRHRLLTTGEATITRQQLEGWDAFEQMIDSLK